MRYNKTGVTRELPSSKSCQTATGMFATVKHPEDVLFYASLQLQNIVTGSRYRVAVASSNVEIIKGTAGASIISLSDLPVYENPTLIKIDVRKASDGLRYQPYVTYGYLRRLGSSVYISQIREIV